MTLQERFEAVARDNFLGVPIAGFEASGRDYPRETLTMI